MTYRIFLDRHGGTAHEGTAAELDPFLIDHLDLDNRSGLLEVSGDMVSMVKGCDYLIEQDGEDIRIYSIGKCRVQLNKWSKTFDERVGKFELGRVSVSPAGLEFFRGKIQ